MPSSLPYLIQQIKDNYGIAPGIAEEVRKAKKKFVKENDAALLAILEAHDQYMITHLSKAVQIHIESVVIKDILTFRKVINKGPIPKKKSTFLSP